jgi:hypothetical protein
MNCACRPVTNTGGFVAGYVGGPHDPARQSELVPAGEQLFGHQLLGGIDGRVAPDALFEGFLL